MWWVVMDNLVNILFFTHPIYQNMFNLNIQWHPCNPISLLTIWLANLFNCLPEKFPVLVQINLVFEKGWSWIILHSWMVLWMCCFVPEKTVCVLQLYFDVIFAGMSSDIHVDALVVYYCICILVHLLLFYLHLTLSVGTTNPN